MKINSFNQNFGANIIKNTTYNNAFENAQRANEVGCFSQTIEFINAVQAIQNTDKFDTFEIQQKGLGFSFVEILSSCPTNWKMTPQEAHERVREEMMPVFPLGVFKDMTNAVGD